MFSKLQSTFAALGLLFFALITAFQVGRHKQRKHQEVKELNEYVETRRRIDNALSNPDLTTADDFLRKRKSDRDL